LEFMLAVNASPINVDGRRRISVLLAEDHDTVRQALRLLLDTEPDIRVVAEAANGVEALSVAQKILPDIAVIDIAMPEMNGLVAARQIVESAPGVGIITLTRYRDRAFVQELLAAGARGYVLKQSRSAELLNAIRAVARGDRYIDPALRREPTVNGGRGRSPRREPRISPRERAVLKLVALGYRRKDIGTLLGISVKTVEVHRYNAMLKLELHGRSDVIRFAILQGWLEAQP
jgi:DNA-binding NarL/FixJ family response regulator